ncbi:hypothetical protein EDF58_10439 [Novosphingobium sp. PhB57]|uniref:hypothetical protein n=1 Tax=unclassified Novosphingobium TaxID=2644732 RepID=UPI0010511FE9|nr:MULTISPECIES: hypothetical protein [unclassified Novosphingobium]TCU57802.1 hypothetical protein EDF58_10439 [Novosphingobium sp. PhB57]TDW64606.1 hypothetical protein EDF57_104405 [Novosphingobium sp. PhB55]
MIPQLVERIHTDPSFSALPLDSVRTAVLTADPLDLVLHFEQVWTAWDTSVLFPTFPPSARRNLAAQGQFGIFAPPAGDQAWDHLGYSFALENSRAVQILKRVVREYRSGEALGIPSRETLRWLDVTEALLFGAENPFAAWLSTAPASSDGESARRRAYWRLFGLDLAFGADDNRPPVFDRATAANTGFVGLFEELLFELWQAITNLKNFSGVNASDDDRIFRLTEALMYMLRARRKGEGEGSLLAREELAAATVLGWVDLTFSFDSPVILDTAAQSTSAAGRLTNLGAKVGLAAHSKSTALFEMAESMSKVMRVIESGVIVDPTLSYILYRDQPVGPTTVYGTQARRVITEWSAATGKDLKARARAVTTAPVRKLVGAS